MIEGKGRINIGGVWEDLKLYNAGETLGEDNCYIVMKKADHSFQPQDVDMVLISFHTVLPDELIEIDRGSGEKRFYI
jgi:hypothetical protein